MGRPHPWQLALANPSPGSEGRGMHVVQFVRRTAVLLKGKSRPIKSGVVAG